MLATYLNEHTHILIDVTYAIIVNIHALLLDSDMNMFLFLIRIYTRLLFIQRDQKLINDMYKTKLMLMGLRGENIKTATS